MNNMREHIDLPTAIVSLVTLIVFGMALVFKGLTHDILLEFGVLLVSIKLIISTYKLSVSSKKIEDKIDEQSEILKKMSQDDQE